MRRSIIKNEVNQDIFIYTNPGLLGVVVHNLLDNAIKIKKSNEIKIATRYVNGNLHLIISDQGPGMSPELIEWLNSVHHKKDGGLIFQNKYQGMGLLIIKEILTLLNIDLYVENDTGAVIHLIFKQSKA
jgi:K+-sensing histidine kinase KdpD